MADEKVPSGWVAGEPVYMTDAQVNFILGDFSVAIGRPRYVTFPQARPEPRVEWTHTISMSPNIAKGFAELLLRQIKLYEDTFGIIPTTPKDGQGS